MHRAALSHSAAFDFVTLDAILIVSKYHPIFVPCSLRAGRRLCAVLTLRGMGIERRRSLLVVTACRPIRLPSISSPLMPSFSIPERIFINNHWLTFL